MIVHFEDQKLMRLVSDERRLLKTFGLKRSERIKVRIAQLRSVECMSDLALLPGRWHELTSNLAGHWSGDLDHPYRLLIRPGEPVPRRPDGGVDWSAVVNTVIVGIRDTHE